MARLRPLLATLALLTALAPAAHADGKVELYGLRMDPNVQDSKQYSRHGWGGGVELVAPLPTAQKLFAGVVGVEGVNLLAQTVKFQDALTGLRVEQQTSQNYGRLFAGVQVGSHSSGFLRPYVGANVAAVWYEIHTDVVVPDDSNRENEIRQNLKRRDEVAFGWDANAGVDLNFRNRWNIDAGVRVLHAYGVPQQLGDGAVTIHPGYVQYRIGVGIGLGLLD